MFFDPDEKDEKEEALKKLKDVMMNGMGDRFGKMKKPIAASMTIEKIPEDEIEEIEEDVEDDLNHHHGDEMDEGSDDGDDEDLEELQDLGRQHKKYCMGGKV